MNCPPVLLQLCIISGGTCCIDGFELADDCEVNLATVTANLYPPFSLLNRAVAKIQKYTQKMHSRILLIGILPYPPPTTQNAKIHFAQIGDLYP